MARRVLAAVGVLLLSAAPAAAGEPTERLRTFFERANRVIAAPGSEGGLEPRVSAVRALVNEVFDFDGATVLALGRHWQALPAATRPIVTRLYADIIERGYLALVGGKARLGEGGVSVRWVDERVEGDAATVTSALLTRTGEEVSIDYVLVRRGQDWLVRDVVVDGVSLAASNHVQIERVVQLGSYDALVERLRDRASPTAREEVEAASLVAATAADSASVRAPAPPAQPVAMPAPLAVAPVVSTTASIVAIPAPVVTTTASIVAIPAPVVTTTAPSVTTPAPTVTTAAPPAETPVTPHGRAVAVDTRGDVWVQVGAFRTVDAATKLVRRLSRAVTIATGRDRLARVLVGPFADRAAAASTVRALQASGIAAFIAE